MTRGGDFQRSAVVVNSWRPYKNHLQIFFHCISSDLDAPAKQPDFIVFHVALLVDVPLHNAVLSKDKGCKTVEDALFVFRNIVIVGCVSEPLDRFAGTGMFFKLPGG
jgi:hypothetical protein